jgi:DNA-binding transcriptional ArsR family regulator
MVRRCVDERAPTGHDGTMTTPSQDTKDTAGDTPRRERRRLTDAKEMRALAHPTRVAAIELLSREGSMTATQLGEQLGESPANMSFHLRTLAKYGFVEEAPGGTGRERPWSRVGQANSWELDSDDALTASAAVGLARNLAQRAFDRRTEWELTRSSYAKEWREASFECYGTTYLTADELLEVGEEMTRVLDRYSGRTADRDQRPAGAKPVTIAFHGHPLPPTPAGN